MDGFVARETDHQARWPRLHPARKSDAESGMCFLTENNTQHPHCSCWKSLMHLALVLVSSPAPSHSLRWCCPSGLKRRCAEHDRVHPSQVLTKAENTSQAPSLMLNTECQGSIAFWLKVTHQILARGKNKNTTHPAASNWEFPLCI